MSNSKQILTVYVASIVILTVAGFSPASGQTVAHWTLEEGPVDTVATGTGAIIDVANGYNGTPVGNLTYRSMSTPGGGQLGLEFHGGNRIFIPDDPAFALTESMTLEAFIVADPLDVSTDEWNLIVFRGDSRGAWDPYLLARRPSDGRLVMRLRDINNNYSDVVSADPIPVNELIHVAGTYDYATGQQKVFINWLEVGSTTTNLHVFGDLVPSLDPGIGIGNLEVDGSLWFDGIIAEVRISDVALASSEFIPEPMTLSLLILGGVTLLRRRR